MGLAKKFPALAQTAADILSGERPAGDSDDDFLNRIIRRCEEFIAVEKATGVGGESDVHVGSASASVTNALMTKNRTPIIIH